MGRLLYDTPFISLRINNIKTNRHDLWHHIFNILQNFQRAIRGITKTYINRSENNCQRSESLWEKMIGKPYAGKLNVRFDEGELEIEP